MHSLSLAIVGIQYPNKKGPTRRFEVELCRPGEPVELRPEPKNPADEHAIAIYSCRRVQLGYVTSQRAPWVKKLLGEHEVKAVFQGLAETGAWVRVAFDGEEPVVDPEASGALPHQVKRPRDAPDGFWPDPVYDD